MLRSIISQNKRVFYVIFSQQQTFLTNSYSCADAWNSRFSSSILNKVSLDDFYSSLDQNYTNKGVISAIDVDIYANSIKNGNYLDELKDLIHKLRLSADTGNTLESTHYATVRHFVEHGNMQDLVDIIKDPLNYGIFLDDFTANLALDKLLTSGDFEKAAVLASQVMLQEDFSNRITCSLCQYACFKYVSMYIPPTPEPPPPTTTKIKTEEIKIRIKFLRNPYFDDHFDINDTYLLSGKTLAWISERNKDSLNVNLEILGWCVYRKYDNLLGVCESLQKLPNIKIYKEMLNILEREATQVENEDNKKSIEKCLTILLSLNVSEASFEDVLKINIENAINKGHKKDIAKQEELLKSWSVIREEKLVEQTKRLDRAKRVQMLENKQKELETEEQKLWFFDNEDKIDLQIENKAQPHTESVSKKKNLQKADENYIPPEIIPKRR